MELNRTYIQSPLYVKQNEVNNMVRTPENEQEQDEPVEIPNVAPKQKAQQQQQAQVRIQEVPINLELLNHKLNYIIGLLEKR